MVLWYSGRRQVGKVLSDDGVEMTIPIGGALNRNVVPLTPSGLMHGTRVRCMPVRRKDGWQCISVRPSEGVQQGLTVGVDKQGGSSEDQSHLSAADVADVGFLIGILDGHCGGASAAHVAKRFPGILHDVYNSELSQTRGVAALNGVQEVELLRDSLRGACRAAERDRSVSSAAHSQKMKDLMKVASEGHWTDGTSAVFALLAHGFESKSARTVPGCAGEAKIFLAWCGDSRALLLHGHKVVALSHDHVPSRKEEYNRVKAAGGKVLDFGGTLKVGRRDKYKEKKTTGSFNDLLWLHTTRSFGDIRLKAPFNIVPCEAEVAVRTLTPEDWAIVLVCSKVTSKLKNQDIAEICKQQFLENKDCVAVSQALTLSARKRGAMGNLTAVVMRLGWTALQPHWLAENKKR